MSTKMTQLAVIDHSNLLPIVPSAEDLAAIREELSDMDRVPYGRIKIAAGGVNIFQVFEPGEEEAVPAQTSLPVRGAWIEIPQHGRWALLPLRRSPCGERGLKFRLACRH